MIASVGWALLAALAGEGGATAFVDVRLVDPGRGVALAGATLVVEGERIVAAGPAAEVAVPPGATVVQGHGGALLPGLIDLHTHPQTPNDLVVYLAHGVTTIRVLNGATFHLDWRARQRAGALEGAALFVSMGPVNDVQDAEGARAVALEAARDGFDGIKIYDRVSAEAYAALVGEARARGLMVSGHVPRNLHLDLVLLAPPDALDHLEELIYGWPELDGEPWSSEQVVGALVEARVAIVSTLVKYASILEQASDLEAALAARPIRTVRWVDRRLWLPGKSSYARRFGAEDVPMLRERLALQQRIARELVHAGGTLLVGTDSPTAVVTAGSSLVDELRLLVAGGLTPAEALRAATSDAAAFLGLAGERGTLAPGARADLVLVAGDPLADLACLERPAGVMQAGRWHAGEALARRLEAIARAYDAERPIVEYALAADPIDAERLRALLAAAPPELDAQGSLNELGYQLLFLERDAPGAVRVFRANAEQHPASAGAWASLGEGLAAAGSEDEAGDAYRRSLALQEDAEVRRALEALAGEAVR